MGFDLNDPTRCLPRIYADHSPNPHRELTTTRKGFLVKNQDSYGRYITRCPGTEVCWIFWPPAHKAGKKSRVILET